MERIECVLSYPKGSIKSAIVDFEQVDGLGHDFRVWVYMGGVNVEFQKGWVGSSRIATYYPFDGHDEYHDDGEVCHRGPINSLEDWKAWLLEYAPEIDPRDIFRYRRLEGL